MNKEVLSILNYKPEDKHHYILLLSAPLLITLYRYFSISEHFMAYFPSLASLPKGEIFACKMQFMGFFILMFLIPVCHVIFGWKKPLESLGFGLGDSKYGIKFIVLTISLLVLPIAWCGSMDASVTSEYPLAKSLIEYKEYVFSYHIFYIIFYYVAWEFYFRGYLLFGLKERYGAMEAILIQTISSCLIHIDKPFSEIFLSIPVGIFLGFIALRCRSFWYVFVVHATLGVLTDLFIIYFQN